MWLESIENWKTGFAIKLAGWLIKFLDTFLKDISKLTLPESSIQIKDECRQKRNRML